MFDAQINAHTVFAGSNKEIHDPWVSNLTLLRLFAKVIRYVHWYQIKDTAL